MLYKDLLAVLTNMPLERLNTEVRVRVFDPTGSTSDERMCSVSFENTKPEMFLDTMGKNFDSNYQDEESEEE
jgi:hypothetical protein